MADKDPDDWSADIQWTGEDNSKEVVRTEDGDSK